jgi:hypothetical protein
LSEWSQCPGCSLKFRTRASGTCPRCGAAYASEARPAAPAGDIFDEEVFARQQAQRAAATTRSAEGEVDVAVRVAGALLALNGMLQLSVGALESSAEGAFLDPWLASFDLVVGGILASGQLQVKSWATVRAALGGVGLIVAHLVVGQAPAGALGILFGIGLLLLLTGKPDVVRRAAGATVAGAAMIVGTAAGGPFLGVRSPTGALAARLNREVQWAPVGALEGEKVGYRLPLPDKRWHLVNEAPEEPEADEAPEDPKAVKVVQELSRSVRRPDANLDVQVVGLKFPPQVTLDAERAMSGMEDEMRDNMPELMVLEDKYLSSPHGDLKVLEGTAWIDGRRTSVALGFGVRGQCVVVLSGAAPPRIYPKVREDLMSVFSSLETTEC